MNTLWHKVKSELSAVPGAEIDMRPAFLAVAMVKLGTADIFKLQLATEIEPGWINRQIGDWQRELVILGQSPIGPGAVERLFPETRSILERVLRGEFDEGADVVYVRPLDVAKPESKSATTQPQIQPKTEQEQIIMEKCQRTPGCEKPFKHMGACKKSAAKTVTMTTPRTITRPSSVAPVLAQKESARISMSPENPLTLETGMLTITFESDSPKGTRLNITRHAALPMSALRNLVAEFDAA